MPVVMVLFLRVSSEGGSAVLVNPVGTITTGKPTRLPTQTFSQSVALLTNASTVKLSLTSRINFPRALCPVDSHSVLRTRAEHSPLLVLHVHGVVQEAIDLELQNHHPFWNAATRRSEPTYQQPLCNLRYLERSPLRNSS